MFEKKKILDFASELLHKILNKNIMKFSLIWCAVKCKIYFIKEGWMYLRNRIKKIHF